jgi:hypothetical protein
MADDKLASLCLSIIVEGPNNVVVRLEKTCSSDRDKLALKSAMKPTRKRIRYFIPTHLYMCTVADRISLM